MGIENAIMFIELAAAFVLLGAVPGSIAWLLMTKNQSKIETVVFGSIMGLVLFALGGVISYWTQLYYVRFFPSFLLIVFGLLNRKRSWFRCTNKEKSGSLIISGAVLGFIAILAQLLVTLRSQPTSWEGWWTFYGDLPFHVALTSEIINRAPNTFPWFPGTEMNYTWMVHSALGVWGSVNNASADFMVLQAWPVLFSILLPLSISAFAYRFGNQKYVVLFAASITALFIGPIGLQGTFFEYFPTYSISPTHELSQILIIAIILLITSKRSFEELDTRIEKLTLGILVLFVFFVATGTKGVMPLFILAAVGSFWALHLLNRTLSRDHSLTLFLAIAGITLALVSIVDTGGSLGIEPFNLLSDNASEPKTRSYISLALLLIWIAGSVIVLFANGHKMQEFAVLIGATASTSVLATFVLSHPGKSQAYFFWSIVPVLVVAIFYSLSKLSTQRNPSNVLAAAFMVYATYTVISMFPAAWSDTTKLKLLFAVPLTASFVFLLLLLRSDIASRFKPTLAYILLVTMLVSFFAQPFRFRADTWSVQASDGSGNNVSSELITDMRKLKEFSNADDVVVTNRICEGISPSVFADCGPRYWFLSGYSERQVYFETYAYVMSNEIDSAESRVLTTSKFITSPSNDVVILLWSEGVRWIFIDKSRTYSDYSAFARLKLETNSSQIWEINEPQ